jgi:CRP-like cAMP-binding protein
MAPKWSNGHLQNRLLAALPPQAFSLFKSDLRASTFKQGAIVQEAGEPVDQIYFPQTGMISLLVVTQEGVGIEAATIGRAKKPLASVTKSSNTKPFPESSASGSRLLPSVRFAA